MVTWAGDGTMAGYDPVTKRLKKGLYHFATPGTVDLNAITRIQYMMGEGLSKTTYPNTLQVEAPFTFSDADFNANGGRKLGVGLIMVPAASFPEGHIPTPAEIFALPLSQITQAMRATEYAYGPGPVTHTFELPTSTDFVGGFLANFKFWVLVYPASHYNISASWSWTNDPPLSGSDINVVGRVLSFWTNRTPGQPTIASPLDGSIALPGTDFTLRLDPADPDAVIPQGPQKYNSDVNGVQFQYRPTPTVDNPNPDWTDLPFDWAFDVGGTMYKSRDEAWHIRGSSYWNGMEATPYHEALVANLGCSVVAGAGDSNSDFVPGKGALPTGDWQLRGRTFDYGHPYPNSGTSLSEPGPLGINPATTGLVEPAKDTYSVSNTSPWSEPVRITIPSQVPPPLAVYPKDDLAVSGNAESVPLQWKYRNTHQPARGQYTRTVQIRKVGDAAWSTVFSGIGSAPSVDLPMDLTQIIVPPYQAQPDGTFEAGTMIWESGGIAPMTFTNVNNPVNAHSGNRYLRITNPPATPRANEYVDDFAFNEGPLAGIPEGYVDFAFDMWFWIDATVPVTVTFSAVWLDENDEPVYGDPHNPFDSPFVMSYISKKFTGAAGWRRLSDLIPDTDFTDYVYGEEGALGADPGRLTFKRPSNGVKLFLGGTAYIDHENPMALPNLRTEMRLDDVTITATSPVLDDFTMTPTNQYQWRVEVTDTDGVASGYSTPARFWVVPGGATGEVRPVPAETLDGATLGCGTYTVEIYRRGGTRHVGTLSGISHLDWSRVRDDISTAQVVISGWDLDCGNLLARLQTWAYELVIWRSNGYSTDRVWEGPITLLTYENDKVTIDAKDVMGYAYRRIIRQKMTDSGKGNGTTVVDRARRIIQNAFAPDDPNVLAYLQVLSRKDDAMQYRSTPAYSRTAFEEVDDMAANSGLDYTAVGRAILLWGTKHRIGTLPEFRDENLGASPIVSEYGMSMANVYSVSDGNGVHGEATRGLDPVSGNNEDYGLVEMLSSTWASDSEEDSGTYTQAGLATVIESFKGYAERSIADRYPPPVVVRIPDNTSLNPNTPISIQHLVPGVVVPLRSTSTLRTVKDSQKLDSVKVVQEKGTETVSITLSPFSRDDASVVEGDL